MMLADERVTVQAIPVGVDENALVSELFRRKYPPDQHLYAILRPEVIAATLRLELQVSPR